MLTAALLALLACSAAAEPKHVILLFTDEQDGRTVDPTHPLSRVVETPAFSRLAKNGANFIRTYTPSPQCVPGRVATFTSKHTVRRAMLLAVAKDPYLRPLQPRAQRWRRALASRSWWVRLPLPSRSSTHTLGATARGWLRTPRLARLTRCAWSSTTR